MKIKYLGHACFYISNSDCSVIIDPFGDIGYEQEEVTADYCLMSHDHFDHATLTKVHASKVYPSNSQTFPSFVKVVNCFHDEVQGQKRGKNNVYILELKGFRICHLGDIGQDFTPQFCDKLGKIDILLIPVGGKYTINAKEAVKYADYINAKITIPMHYKTNRSDIDIAFKQEFLNNYTNVLKVEQSFEIEKLPLNNVVYDVNDQNF